MGKQAPISEINWRRQDIETINTSNDNAAVEGALHRYGSAVVHVAQLQRRTYGTGIVDRFTRCSALLLQVYRNPGVVAFAVKGDRLDALPSPAPPPVPARPTAPPEVQAQEPRGVFHQPYWVACDVAGNVHIADFGKNRIQELGADLKPLAVWGRRGSEPGEVRDPCGVALGLDGNVYVADT